MSQLWNALQATFAAAPVTLRGVLEASGCTRRPDEWLRDATMLLRIEQLVEGWKSAVPAHLRGEGHIEESEGAGATTVGVNDLGFLFDAALTKQQFDALRFGVFLDDERRLLLLAVDSDADVSAFGSSASSIFADASTTALSPAAKAVLQPTTFRSAVDDDDSTIATASSVNTQVISKEHELLVVQLADDAFVLPVFRLVFRNEAAAITKNSAGDAAVLRHARHFPVYRLRAVYVPHAAFYSSCDDIAAAERKISLQQSHTTAHIEYWRGLHAAAVSQARAKGNFDVVCDLWVAVLQGIAYAAMAARPSDAAVLEDPYVVSATMALKASSTRALQQLNECGVCCPYATSRARLAQRIVVAHKTPKLLSDWREGNLGQCHRVVFRESRNGKNFIERDELVAFLPHDTDFDRRDLSDVDSLPMSPRDASHARLRLWILKALITAEVHGVHQLLLELDYPTIIGVCIGFLEIGAGQEEELRRHVGAPSEEELKLRNAIFHISRIAVETIEDFVQHSGVVWRVVLTPREEANVLLLQSLLTCVQDAKEATELYMRRGPDVIEAAAAAEADVSAVVAAAAGEPRQAGTLQLQQPPLPRDVLNQAASRRLRLDDDSLFALFKYLDVTNEGRVSVDELTKVFLCKENRIRHFHERKNQLPYRRLMTIEEEAKKRDQNLALNPLTALDGCGLPFDESSIRRFILSFCRGMRLPRRNAARSATAEPIPTTMSFVEFSVMMLSLAKR